MNSHLILWLYIVLLVAGGLFGFFKAGSRVSLLTAGISATLLALANTPGLLTPGAARGVTSVILALLLLVFTLRLAKTRKFMPSGLMLVLTLAALALHHLAS